MAKKSYTSLVCLIGRPEGQDAVTVTPLEKNFEWVNHPDGLMGEDGYPVQVKKVLPEVMLTADEAAELNLKTPQNGIYYQLTNQE